MRSSSTSRRPGGAASSLVRTIETHTHADHLSGHGRLAFEHDVPVSVHPAAEAGYEHDPLEDGAELEFGQRRASLPAHARSPAGALLPGGRRPLARRRAWLVLTGDSLFVGDAARPDLAVEAREGADGVHSLRRLLELPDGVEVFPGHVAGSLCGKS